MLDNTDQNTLSPQELEDAFNNFVDSGLTDYSLARAGATDDDATQEDSSTEGGGQSTTDADNTMQPQNQFETSDSSDLASIDYQKLYNETKHYADSQISLLNGRLQNISTQYQSLKKDKGHVDTDDIDLTDAKNLPANVKDVFETYPDIADAVKQYVALSINKSAKQLKTEVDSKVKPIEQKMVTSDAERHLNSIRSSHPDVIAIRDSGDLVKWINGLPPVMRTGAAYVYQYGTAEEIVSLLSDYKQARGTVKGKASSVQQQGTSQDSANTDEIVKRVMAAMNVPTTKEPISIGSGKSSKQESPQDEFMRIALQYEKDRRI